MNYDKIINNKKYRVAIYCRVSTEEQVQNGNWLEIQRQALINHVENNNYQLDKKNIYIEKWKSGAYKDKERRPILWDMFEWAQNNEFDILLVWKIDRLFRKTSYLLSAIEVLDNLWVGFVSITQPYDTTSSHWKLLVSMLGSIAEMERDTILERTSNWILASMRQWKWGRWNPPYWYRKGNDWYLEIHDEEWKNIRLMFDMLVNEKLSLGALVNKVNSFWITTQASSWALWDVRKQVKHINHWNIWTIHRLLRNDIYTGKMIQNRHTIDKLTKKKIDKPESEWIIWECPQIISDALYEQVKKQLQYNLTHSPRNKVKPIEYMLSTLLIDKETWYKYCWYKSAKWTKNYRLLLDKTKSKDIVPRKWISWNKIESVVWNKIKKVLTDPDLIIMELNKISNIKDDNDTKKQIDMLNVEIEKLEQNSKKILCLIWDLSSSADIDLVKESININREKIETHQKDIKNLESRIVSENLKKQQLKDLKKLAKKLMSYIENDKLSYESKTHICRLLVEKIEINKENVEITLIVPVENIRDRGNARKEIVNDFFEDKQDFISNTKINNKKTLENEITSVELLLNYGSTQRKPYIYISIKGWLSKYRLWRVWKTEFKTIQWPSIYFK